MKKFVIYLLTLIMALSPAAVFAETAVDGAADDAVPAEDMLDAEAPEAEEVPAAEEETPAVEEAAEEAEAVEDAVAPEEEPAAEEEVLVQEEPAAADPEETKKYYGGNDECHWIENSSRTKASLDTEGQKQVYSLFKAQRAAGKLGLYYADEETGIVVAVEGLVTPKTGNQFTYTKVNDETGWSVTGGGPYTYLIKNHDGDYYITNVLKGIETIGNGKSYYIENGRVKTTAGVVQDNDGTWHFVQDGGEVLKTESIVYDKNVNRYRYVDSKGLVQMNEAVFTYRGQWWYRDASGYVNKTAGILVTYKGSSQYYTNSDGSLFTTAGKIITLSNGKKYITGNSGVIRKTAGPVSLGGKWYLAETGGAIRTTKGFCNAGGYLYYVTSSDGVLKANSAFKVGSKSYHAASNGVIYTGVHKWGKYYYYSLSSGALKKKAGIVKWNGNYYHVKKTGKITTNKKVTYKKKSYIASPTGAIYKRIFTWKKNMYYANGKGVLRTRAGLFKYNGNRYYSKSGGKLYRDTMFTAGGKKYYAQANAAIKIGYFAYNGKYYLTNDTGAIYTKAGIYNYGGKQYYVKKGGAMAKNEFVTSGDNHYYVGADGAIVKKTFTYKGIRITPNSGTGVISLEDYWKVFPNEKPAEKTEPDAANGNNNNN